MHTVKSIIRTVATLLALATIAAACGSGDAEAGVDANLDDAALTNSADQATSDANAADSAIDASGDEPQLLAVGTSASDTTAAPGSGDSTSDASAGGGATTATSAPGSATAAAPGEATTSSTVAALRVATSGSSATTTGTSAGQTTVAAGPTTSEEPATATSAPTTRRTTTTQAPATTAAPTTARETSTTSGGGGGSGYFATLPAGASLPSGAWCAARVKSAAEIRPGNASYNQTRGTNGNGRYPRVDGNFVGTTDEIIQWAACKWGIDEDVARAQAAKESWWQMTAGGDRTSDQSKCHPDLRTGSGQCAESIGLLQVRFRPHEEAFEDSNAIRSTAYNVDYTYAVWRDCYDGGLGWLNTVERGREYSAGDLDGCLGVWFSGRWYTDRAVTYVGEVKELLRNRIWEQSQFRN